MAPQLGLLELYHRDRLTDRVLQNLEDTVGNWELYGNDDPKRYPALQNEFFERAVKPLERREVLAALLFLGESGRCCLWT